MGEVYKATDMKLGREVAIKVLPPPLASDADRMAKVVAGGAGSRVAESSEIASIYGVEDGALILELIDGPTLDEQIAKGPVHHARQIVDQLIDALEYAHERASFIGI